MKIGIIGAGFTGLSAAYYLQKDGHEVTVFEKDEIPGGLALGFKENVWDWTLEKHYHHWFTNDKSVLDLAKEINHDVLIKRPITSVYLNDGKIYQLDSPIAVLKFAKLSILERLRMAAVLGLFFKYNPIWKPLEKINAEPFLKSSMGKKTYELIWEPQLLSKFGKYKNDVSLAWFWARVHKRTTKLAYPNGGFLDFANHLVKEVEKKGGKVLFKSGVEKIESNKKVIIKADGKKFEFDKVIVTLPSFYFSKIADLPESYLKKMSNLKGLGAINLVLRLKEPFFKDSTYWLSVCDKEAPILAIVEHTNFMDKKNYNNENLLYLGNYLPSDHPYFSMDKKDILKKYDPFLKKLNPDYGKSIIDFEAFKAPFAQPIIPVNYSKMIPPTETPLKNVYLANIQQVYPWDRGTNYAVELGKKVAEQISK